MPGKFSLWNLDASFLVYHIHLGLVEAEAQAFISVFRRRAISKFLFSVLHFKQENMVRAVETAHALINVPS